eukprot:1758173-Lingulodinium_polyedra.AAC.1
MSTRRRPADRLRGPRGAPSRAGSGTQRASRKASLGGTPPTSKTRHTWNMMTSSACGASPSCSCRTYGRR